MLDGIGVFNVEQHHIGLVENGIELLGWLGSNAYPQLSRQVCTRPSGLLCIARDPSAKNSGCQERLAAGHRNTTAAVKLMVTLEFVHKVLNEVTIVPPLTDQVSGLWQYAHRMGQP